MFVTTYKQWNEWAEHYTMLPYVQSFPLENDRILSWEYAWKQANPGSFVLESGKGGRYTFLGLQPISEIRGKHDQAIITNTDGSVVEQHGASLELVRQWMEPFHSPVVDKAPKFLGGCVGFWGYDVVRSIEKLPETSVDDLDIPDYAFVRFDQVWIIDHEKRELYCSSSHQWNPSVGGLDELEQLYSQAAADIYRMKERWDRIAVINNENDALRTRDMMLKHMDNDQLHIDVDSIEGIKADFPREAYIDAVNAIKDYIGAGDVFQVNLSVRQHKRLTQSPEEIYEWLRVINPSPYMAMMRFEDFQLVSGSPELLVQLESGVVRARPIAGTRPRGKNAEEDRKLADELIHHEKERAEHIMLVDLERNDLGRISTYGTVKVKDFMVIEYYSHVMHIVSQVEGQLAEGNGAYEVIAAKFPGGTITGAPKIRTMQIIEELEPVRRGPYTGSIGWMDYNGNMEFNIVIRTLVVVDGIGYVQAGAGIVIDSIPEKEYTESINKAKALWKAIQYSELSVQNPV
ncbi:anthranilate synthase component I family protein [Paenibacillus periandrae]|uniref:anthranilate synthase component I family protein n=1 Tax=Paenibacillus periandrae TaxID=1761741 RepID=UPI001F0912A5